MRLIHLADGVSPLNASKTDGGGASTWCQLQNGTCPGSRGGLELEGLKTFSLLIRQVLRGFAKAEVDESSIKYEITHRACHQLMRSLTSAY